MKLSIDISMYPLQKEYGPAILDFIARLETHHPTLTIRRNTLSTQVFGDYDALMDIMKKEIKTTFEALDTTVMVMKLVNEELV